MNDGSEVSVRIDGNNMEFVLRGPADRWFSFGFGNQKMQDTYAIIVHGDSITEHKLDMKSTSQANTVLPRGMVAINSDITKGDLRIVTLSSSMTRLGDIFKAKKVHVISASADAQSADRHKPAYHGKQNRAC